MEAIKETYIVDRISRVLGIKVDGWVPSVLTEEIPCKKLIGRKKEVHIAKSYHAAKMRVAISCLKFVIAHKHKDTQIRTSIRDSLTAPD